MNRAVSVIPYKTPHRTSTEYADRALGHLKTLERFDSRLLAYMLAPSNVLALAGLRSYSPYNDEFRFAVDHNEFDKLLASYGFLWMDEQPNIASPPLPSYALVNFEVADRLQEMYPLDAVATNGKVPERSPWGLFAWQAGLDIALARAMESGNLPKDWLSNWWSPMNIRFGMLLGYPGVAISSFVQAENTMDGWKGMADVCVSPGLFNSARVAFAVAKKQLHSREVTQTVELWRTTLAEVYKIYPEEALMKDTVFAATVSAKV